MNIPLKSLEQHIAVLGKTGSGKSYLSKGIAEYLLKQKARVCVVDPTSGWWGLRSDSTGKRPAFPINVFGGEHGDLALSQAHGSTIAEVIGTTDTSAVLDTRHMSVGERTRFFTDFAETLLRKNKGTLHLIIDEAHLFMPQGRVNDPQSGKMLHAGNNLVSLGRGVGLRIIMISQRPAKLHKDSLTQVETLIAMRLIAPQDRAAVEDWIGEWADPKKGKEVLASLPSLPTGEGWVWSPALDFLKRVKFPKITTYDSSRAPDGVSGKVVLANIDLASIQNRLESVASDAFNDDPKRLRARIIELERQVKSSSTTQAPEVEGAIVKATFDRGAISVKKELARELSIYEKRVRVNLRNAQNALQSAHEDIAYGLKAFDQESMLAPSLPILEDVIESVSAEESAASVKRAAGTAGPQALARAINNYNPPSSRVMKAVVASAERSPQPANGERDPAIGNSGISRMLIALAQWPGGTPASKLGVRSKVSERGGSFDTYLSRARKSGWIEGDKSSLRITSEGLLALGSYDPLPIGKEAQAYWISKFGSSGAARMLQALCASYPRSLTAEELGEASGISTKGGSFDTYLSRLRSFDLIEGDRKGLRITEDLA